MFCGRNDDGKKCSSPMKKAYFSMLLFVTLATARASIVVNPWAPIFKGIDDATGNEVTPDNFLLAINAMRIDLQDQDVQMFTDPPSTNCTFGFETLGVTTSGFLKAYGVQAAVNANFYSPCCSATPGTPMDVFGLSISMGRVVSAQEPQTDNTSLLIRRIKKV